MGYELYSWQSPNGDWNFCVLFNTSSEKTIEEVFDAKTTLRGVNQLKQKLSTLPEGARIFWLDRIPTGTGPKAKGSGGLRYPPSDIIEEIRHYAEAHKIRIEVVLGK
jgi:hypothetical protein